MDTSLWDNTTGQAGIHRLKCAVKYRGYSAHIVVGKGERGACSAGRKIGVRLVVRRGAGGRFFTIYGPIYSKRASNPLGTQKASTIFGETHSNFFLFSAKRTPIFFACGKKGPAQFYRKRGAAAALCLRYVEKKTGFTTKRCTSATFPHQFYALLRPVTIEGQTFKILEDPRKKLCPNGRLWGSI